MALLIYEKMPEKRKEKKKLNALTTTNALLFRHTTLTASGQPTQCAWLQYTYGRSDQCMRVRTTLSLERFVILHANRLRL